MPRATRNTASYARVYKEVPVGQLTLVTTEAIVVVLARIGALRPLGVGRLPSTAITTTALGATVAHVLASVVGRRLSTGTAIVTRLATVLSG